MPPKEEGVAAAALQGADSNPGPVPEESATENEAQLQASSFLPPSPVEPAGTGDQPATSQAPESEPSSHTIKDTQQQQQQPPISQKATPPPPGPGPGPRSRKGAGRGQLAKRFSKKDTVATRTRAHTKPATATVVSFSRIIVCPVSSVFFCFFFAEHRLQAGEKAQEGWPVLKGTGDRGRSQRVQVQEDGLHQVLQETLSARVAHQALSQPTTPTQTQSLFQGEGRYGMEW